MAPYCLIQINQLLPAPTGKHLALTSIPAAKGGSYGASPALSTLPYPL